MGRGLGRGGLKGGEMDPLEMRKSQEYTYCLSPRVFVFRRNQGFGMLVKMIRDAEFFKKFEEDFITKYNLPYEQGLKIFEAMWEEGVSLGVLPPKDPLEGIEVDIKIARVLNSCSKS